MPGNHVMDVRVAEPAAPPPVPPGEPRVQPRQREGEQEGKEQQQERLLACLVDLLLVAGDETEDVHLQ